MAASGRGTDRPDGFRETPLDFSSSFTDRNALLDGFSSSGNPLWGGRKKESKGKMGILKEKAPTWSSRTGSEARWTFP